MISVNKIVKDSLSAHAINTHIAYVIVNQNKTYYLSTNPLNMPLTSGGDNVFWSDIIVKSGKTQESIDLTTKKIKLSGSTISISNTEQHGKRFTDTIDGEMHGATIDAYMITPSCNYVEQGVRLSSLVVTGVQHDDSVVTLTCQDKFIDSFHKELPLSENTLYQDINTFSGNNNQRIPILYGHLKNAPAIAYIRNHEDESTFADNNVLILPDKAYLTTGTENEYDIVGIKNISPYTFLDSDSNQLINPNVLFIGLGDGIAHVYSTVPDKANKYIVEGNPEEHNEFASDWKTQYIVSEDKNYIQLYTDSHEDSSKYASSGTFLCAEVSPLISIKTHLVTAYIGSTWFADFVNLVHHYTSSDTTLQSSGGLKGINMDMLSYNVFNLDDMTSANTYNAIDINLGTPKYGTGIDIESGQQYAQVQMFHYKVQIPVIELEFSQLKSQITLAEGKERTFTDANLYASWKKREKLSSVNERYTVRARTYAMAFYGSQGSQEADITSYIPYWDYGSDGIIDPNADGEFPPSGYLDISDTILGIPSDAYGQYGSLSDWETGDNGYIWEWTNPINHLRWNAHMSIDCNIEKQITGSYATDYRHVFQNRKPLGIEITNTNDWRVAPHHVGKKDWTKQNIYTGLLIPNLDFEDEPDATADTNIAMNFGGMMLKRTWYQNDCYQKNFFVNAKGKYKQTPNREFGDYNQTMQGENMTLYVRSLAGGDLDTDAIIDTEDGVLLMVQDYLTKDRFKKFYNKGVEYDLVLIISKNGVEQFLLYDIDITDMRNLRVTDSNLDYGFTLDSMIYRLNEDGDEFWNINENQSYSYTEISLGYASKNLLNNGLIDSWSYYHDSDEQEMPFPVPVRKIVWDYDPNTNTDVELYFGTTQQTDDYIDSHVEPTIYTDAASIKSLIQRPSEVINDIFKKEFGLNDNILQKNIYDKKYKLDFSVNKTEKGLDVLQEIANCSPFFYCTSISDNLPRITGVRNFYTDSHVDKKIYIDDLIKSKYYKSAKKDIAMKVRVKYGYDYNTDTYTKVSEDQGHPNVIIPQIGDRSINELYKEYYSIDDENDYTIEVEAKYVQDKVTAEVLAKHVFEMHKNQHLIIDFQISIKNAVEMQVGDVISFVNNKGLRSNINNTQPYGLNMSTFNLIINQAVLPYFMITSIGKDKDNVNIKAVQLHELAPSDYDDWQITHDFEIPNVAPTIQIVSQTPANGTLVQNEPYEVYVQVDDPDNNIQHVKMVIKDSSWADPDDNIIIEEFLTQTETENIWVGSWTNNEAYFNEIYPNIFYGAMVEIQAEDDLGAVSNIEFSQLLVSFSNAPPVPWISVKNLDTNEVIVSTSDITQLQENPIIVPSETLLEIDISGSYDFDDSFGWEVLEDGTVLRNGIKNNFIQFGQWIEFGVIEVEEIFDPEAPEGFLAPQKYQLGMPPIDVGGFEYTFEGGFVVRDRYNEDTELFCNITVLPEEPPPPVLDFIIEPSIQYNLGAGWVNNAPPTFIDEDGTWVYNIYAYQNSGLDYLDFNQMLMYFNEEVGDGGIYMPYQGEILTQYFNVTFNGTHDFYGASFNPNNGFGYGTIPLGSMTSPDHFVGVLCDCVAILPSMEEVHQLVQVNIYEG